MQLDRIISSKREALEWIDRRWPSYAKKGKEKLKPG